MCSNSQIVWINGPFGIGKSTTTSTLLSRNPGWVLFDPELLGDVATLASAETVDDFQDLPLWRSLVSGALQTISRSVGTTILVPMTMTNEDYAREVFEPLATNGTDIFLVELRAPVSVLLERIENHVMYPNNPQADNSARNWRREHAHTFEGLELDVARCKRAIDTSNHGATDVSNEIENFLKVSSRGEGD